MISVKTLGSNALNLKSYVDINRESKWKMKEISFKYFRDGFSAFWL
jgi:hypothetical protein